MDATAMNGAKIYRWNADGERHELRLIWVQGTGGEPYLFGGGLAQKPIDSRGRDSS